MRFFPFRRLEQRSLLVLFFHLFDFGELILELQHISLLQLQTIVKMVKLFLFLKVQILSLEKFWNMLKNKEHKYIILIIIKY